MDVSLSLAASSHLSALARLVVPTCIFLLPLSLALLYMRLTAAMTLSKQTIVIAGLPVHVYSERHLTEHNGPVAVMFFLHGRNGDAKGIEWIVEDTMKQVAQKRRCHNKDALELVMVTFVSTPSGFYSQGGYSPL